VAYRLRFVPSVFLISWSALNFAQFNTFSTIDDLDTRGQSVNVPSERKLSLTLLHELLRKCGLGPEFRGQQRHGLLSLTVERRILDECIDEYPHMLLDLRYLDRCGFVLLRNGGDEVLRDLVRDIIDVRTAFDRGYRVGERDVLERAVRHRKADLPTIANAFVEDRLLRLRRAARDLRRGLCSRVQVHLDVLLEALHFEPLVVQVHLDILDRAGHIVHALLEQRSRVRVNRRHAEAFQIGRESHARVFLAARVLRDLGLAAFTHVAGPGLLVFLTRVLVRGVDREFGRVDVRELRAVAVSTTGELLLVVVVI
jgi:hypothetical protein